MWEKTKNLLRRLGMGEDDGEKKESRSQKMGLLGAISYIIGNIVGSGIFITPTSIYKKTNSVGLALIVWILAALISMLGSFCYVELGTSIRMSGGDFAYMCFMKWYPIAFAFMTIGCTINYPATLAVQAQTFAEYMFRGFSIELDDTSDFWAKKLLGFALIWLLMFMNFFSLKTFVSRFSIAASICKMLATGIVIVTGFYFLIFKQKTENIKDPFQGTTFALGSFVTALFAGLFSYDGWDILNFGAEEIEKPKRTMPLAIIIGMCSIAVIYVAVNLSYFIILDRATLNSSQAVAIDFADQTLGQAHFVMPIVVAILLVGSLNSTMFSASRYLQAVSKHGHLPTCISGINPISDSPRVALMLHVFIAMGVSFAGDPDNLINYVAFAQWSQRAFTMAALVWIRFRRIPVHPDKIRIPIFLPAIFGLICATLVVVTIIDDFKSAAVGLGILLFGLIVFCIFVWNRACPSLHRYDIITTNINQNTTIWAQIIFDVMPEVKEGEDNDAAIGRVPGDNKVHPESIEPIAFDYGEDTKKSALSSRRSTLKSKKSVKSAESSGFDEKF